MKRITVLLLFYISTIHLNGQVPLINKVSAEQRFDNYIIVQATIDGQQLNLLVDTGATTSVLSNKADKRLKSSTQSRVKKISDGFQKVKTEVKKYNLQIGNHTFKKINFHVIDEVKIYTLLGIDGIIGINLLKRMPFKITKGSITFSEKAEHLLSNPNTPSLILRKYKNSLKVHGKMGEEWATNGIIVDVGSNKLLTLNPNVYTHKRKSNLNKYKSTFGVGKSYQSLLSGNNDLDTTELILAPKFSFAYLGKRKKFNQLDYDELLSPVLIKSNSSLGAVAILGNEILDYYDLVFDIKKRDFYPIQKEGTYNNPNYDTFGLGIIPGDTTRIGIIWRNSPADKAGLQSGWIVTYLNNIDLTPKSTLSIKEKYNFIVQSLKEKTEISLSYLDASEKKKNTTIKKEPLFSSF